MRRLPADVKVIARHQSAAAVCDAPLMTRADRSPNRPVYASPSDGWRSAKLALMTYRAVRSRKFATTVTSLPAQRTHFCIENIVTPPSQLLKPVMVAVLVLSPVAGGVPAARGDDTG